MKTLEELIKNKLFEYPLISDDSYISSLGNIFFEFENSIKKLEDKEEWVEVTKELDNVKILNKQIIDCVYNFLWGKPHASINHFEKIINSEFVKPKISRLYESVNFGNLNENLFRIRSSNINIGNREKMFHIPFNKRLLVANHRFSIEGLPCLYLDSSIYVCWLEINRPNLTSIYVSSFKPKGDLKIFDLSFDLRKLYLDYSNSKKNNAKEEFIDKFLILPLVMACSFQVKYPDSPFKVEYVFPKLILEWIAYQKDDIIGLKYQSTKVNRGNNDNKYFINYVFPPKKLEEGKKFCEGLVQNFELTNPVVWDILSILPEEDLHVGSIVKGADKIEDVLSNKYTQTKFGSAEYNISQMKYAMVKNE